MAPMDEVQILPMREDDYDAVRALWMTIRGFGIRALDDSREDVARFIRRNPTTSVVAMVGGRIVGSILCGSDGRQGFFVNNSAVFRCHKVVIGTMVCVVFALINLAGGNSVTEHLDNVVQWHFDRHHIAFVLWGVVTPIFKVMAISSHMMHPR